MSPMFRAAGFAAASLLAVIGTAYAAPSQTWDPVPVASSFLDHASVSLQGGDLGLNPAGEEIAVPPPAEPAPVPAPVAGHDEAALAPIAEAVEAPVRRPLAELVSIHAGTATDGAQHECLAGAVYFEAKGESLQGQLGVAEVVLNRARSGRFPSTICGVIKQRGQFSFIRGGGFPPIARSSLAWRKSVAIARIAMAELTEGPAPRALFFHATRVATVGNHVFYR